MSDPLYYILTEASNKIQALGGTGKYNLTDIYNVSRSDTSDLLYIKNKTLELRAMTDVNKLLLDEAVNQPVIKSWFEWGSVVLKMLILNPSETQSRTVEFEQYLPKEFSPEYVIDKGDLAIDHDQDRGLWYVHKDVVLEPGASVTKMIEVKDVWQISDERILALSDQAEELMKPLEGTSYFAQAVTLKTDTDRLLNSISRKQGEYLIFCSFSRRTHFDLS